MQQYGTLCMARNFRGLHHYMKIKSQDKMCHEGDHLPITDPASCSLCTATQATTASSKCQVTVMPRYPWRCYKQLPLGASVQVTVALLVLWLYQNYQELC